jgi:hypothetical protein
VRDLVIVIADLYLAAAATAEPALPGLAQLVRFGERLTLEHGWREWLARWIGRDDLARVAPANVVAARSNSWLATPLHLEAGLTTLHFDARGILRPPPEEMEQLALDFRQTFGSTLVPLDSGEFLLQTSAPPTITTEPARIATGHVAEALPKGEGAPKLRRLGAEIEMWLHEHPVNGARARRNEPAITTLWIWGGGDDVPIERTPAGALPRAFGSDSYLRALWRLAGGEAQKLPQQLDAAFSYAPGAVLVVETGRISRMSVSESLTEVDGRFVAPALQALRRGDLGRLSVLVNDRCLVLDSSAHRKFWRRSRPVLESLR